MYDYEYKQGNPYPIVYVNPGNPWVAGQFEGNCAIYNELVFPLIPMILFLSVLMAALSTLMLLHWHSSGLSSELV